jgi:hypothetical protein
LRRTFLVSLTSAAALGLGLATLVAPRAASAIVKIEGCVVEERGDAALVETSYEALVELRLSKVRNDPHSTAPGQCKAFDGDDITNEANKVFPQATAVLDIFDIGDPESHVNSEEFEDDEDEDEDEDEDDD